MVVVIGTDYRDIILNCFPEGVPLVLSFMVRYENQSNT